MNTTPAFSPTRRRLLQGGLWACGSLFLAGRARIAAAMDELMQEHHHHHAMPSQKEALVRSQGSYHIPDVNLLDIDGESVSLLKLLEEDKPVMLNFIFTTCGAICPVMSATFAQVQADLGPNREDLHMVSISIDPEYDTPEVMKAYADKYGAGEQWQMLTGSLENSIKVQRAFDVYRGDKMDHLPLTFLRGKPEQPWVRLEGFASADDLLHEYRLLAEK